VQEAALPNQQILELYTAHFEHGVVRRVRYFVLYRFVCVCVCVSVYVCKYVYVYVCTLMASIISSSSLAMLPSFSRESTVSSAPVLLYVCMYVVDSR
jgi:hypothetical protein